MTAQPLPQPLDATDHRLRGWVLLFLVLVLAAAAAWSGWQFGVALFS
jgi:hypothetical protein